MARNKKVPTTRAQQWCRQNGDITLFETSAKDSFNVEEAFKEIARSALRENQRVQAAQQESFGSSQSSNGMRVNLAANGRGSNDFLDPRCASC